MPRRTPAGDAFSALVVQVLRLHGLLMDAGDALAKPAGQTSARWQVMAAVEGGPATVAQVARMLSLRRQSVLRVADLLCSDGLAVYTANPAHLRARLLQLTPQGLTALRSIQEAQRVWADALGAQLGEGALSRACRTLNLVARAVRQSAK
jgi:DNA-binding MarR family transcriptional regulator